ncbi:2Fe-2S iron-sulfur cluster binding domain-containing protein [Marinomonas sp. A79]|uniref:2Fe-2S iron-sulfur cluster binding domain-containing protein n=1 Tax=Marinomonas vulgaris TaxID=2823372 RepID=A0ABS5HDI7_9GAMM|nr:class I ribonucleotide reductase maintenance protein YfaE [Marinomonas vulgaris]MBR7889014.1 2Fe-2S iron-sulfur cluster binding domain-containing protein [Marinomonas vulgaris]
MTSTSNPKTPIQDAPVHRVLLGKKQILVTENEPLLVQLERAGIPVEYQCREGYCSSCSIKLLRGQVIYPFEPLAWVQSGYLLACCAIVKSDIEIAFFD